MRISRTQVAVVDAIEFLNNRTVLGSARASDLLVARNELIKKGLVYVPVWGMLAFTAPGMHEFVLRQDVQ